MRPKIHGNGSFSHRVDSVTQLLGQSSNTVRQWCSLIDKGAAKFISAWYLVVQELTWKDVKSRFSKDWTNQFQIANESKVTAEVEPHKEIVHKCQTVFVSKNSHKWEKERMKLAKKVIMLRM